MLEKIEQMYWFGKLEQKLAHEYETTFFYTFSGNLETFVVVDIWSNQIFLVTLVW